MISHFYSDPHFGHERIIELCGRPFENARDMNDNLVRRYNDRVSDDQTVLFVGDAFFMNFEKSKELLNSLNGTKMLVVGNHDRSARRMAEMGFAVVAEEMFVNIAGRDVRVNHYPYRTSDESERLHSVRPARVPGEILIHGHTHSSKKVIGTEIHVGVDAWDFAPASIGEVEKLVREVSAHIARRTPPASVPPSYRT